jgi:NAD(P)-dependent dehydrogenase (short-subunit alcohol dehydrogenase family)
MTDQQITALVTGANRGLGKRFAAQLVERGAKVYAVARRPETIDLPGVIPVQLDITDPESVARAASLASDVNVLINNAGVSTKSSGDPEILADDVSHTVKAQLSGAPA